MSSIFFTLAVMQTHLQVLLQLNVKEYLGRMGSNHGTMEKLWNLGRNHRYQTVPEWREGDEAGLGEIA